LPFFLLLEFHWTSPPGASSSEPDVMTSTLSAIGTITAGATLLQSANGLLLTLLPLRMTAEGLSVSGIGAVATAYGIGFASGCLTAPVLIGHVGHIRAFASLAAVLAVIVLLFTQANSVVAWTGLRAVSGFALAGLFTIADSWISARASMGNRGRLISTYMALTKIALMVSPLSIGLGQIEGDGLFMTVAALLCLSLVPLSATASEEPALPSTIRPNIRVLFSVAPSAVVASFGVGLMNGPVIALAPVYGVTVGLSPSAAAVLLMALQGGSLLFQWPLGWLSDHIDRRIVIAGLASGTSVVSGLIVINSATGGSVGVIVGFALWGGLALCIYAVCVAHASDLVETSRIVPTISTLLTCWAVGMIIGPMLAAALMERIGASGLFVYSGIVSLSVAVFVVIRIVARERTPIRGGFVDLSPSSPATATLGRQTGRKPPSMSPPNDYDD
jgi:MFS family permease